MRYFCTSVLPSLEALIFSLAMEQATQTIFSSLTSQNEVRENYMAQAIGDEAIDIRYFMLTTRRAGRAMRAGVRIIINGYEQVCPCVGRSVAGL